jgi:hypothetical protein
VIENHTEKVASGEQCIDPGKALIVPEMVKRANRRFILQIEESQIIVREGVG